MPEYKDINMEDLKANRPDLATALGNEALAGLETETAAAQAAVAESARQTGAKDPEPQTIPPVTPDPLQETNRRLTAAEDELAQYRAKETVAGVLRESGLPEPSRALVESHFVGVRASDTLAADVKAEVERVKAHDKALVESVRAPGVGFVAGTGDNGTGAGEKFNLRDELREVAGLPAPKEGK